MPEIVDMMFEVPRSFRDRLRKASKKIHKPMVWIMIEAVEEKIAEIESVESK